MLCKFFVKAAQQTKIRLKSELMPGYKETLITESIPGAGQKYVGKLVRAVDSLCTDHDEPALISHLEENDGKLKFCVSANPASKDPAKRVMRHYIGYPNCWYLCERITDTQGDS